MVGAFSPYRKPEYNAVVDAEATRTLFAKWPSEIWASGYEVGLSIKYPGRSIIEDFGYVKDHPVAEAYRLYMKMPYDRPTWDLNAILHAVYVRTEDITNSLTPEPSRSTRRELPCIPLTRIAYIDINGLQKPNNAPKFVNFLYSSSQRHLENNLTISEQYKS
jgi:hypothetical protein